MRELTSTAAELWCEAVGGLVSGPPAESATEAQVLRRHAGRRSLPPSISSVAAAVAPLGCWHVKSAAAYTKARWADDMWEVRDLT